MNKNEFIEQIAKYVKKYAPKYNIKVYSPIIAQAILESAWGTSELSINANNFFGLKWSNKITNDFYIKNAIEQRKDGSYYIVNNTKWCKFSNIEEEGVEGYFKFLFSRGLTRYNNLKNETNYENYVRKIIDDGYATSISYIDNILKIIKDNDLTKYDNKNKEDDIMNYTNSSLVNYVKISPNKTSQRNHKIDTITIHCVVGQVTVESLGDIFASSSRKASSNYGIGKDGKIGMYVEEKDRSWCSSNASNDNRSITIEVASDTSEPFAITNNAYESLIKLVADICKRNGIKKLIWSENKEDRINHRNGCNMTVHRDFANKSCPGTYLYSRHQDIANRVNALLSTNFSKVENSKELYKVRKSWNDAKTQIGAYSILDNAKKACKDGYFVFDSKGNIVYPTNSKQNTSTIKTPSKKSNKEIAKEVLEGKWGNGQIRKDKLKAAGYDYNTIQKLINNILNSKQKTTNKKSNEEIAKEVIKGKWGNGVNRNKKLAAAGYDYLEIQKIVNKLLG